MVELNTLPDFSTDHWYAPEHQQLWRNTNEHAT